MYNDNINIWVSVQDYPAIVRMAPNFTPLWEVTHSDIIKLMVIRGTEPKDDDLCNSGLMGNWSGWMEVQSLMTSPIIINVSFGRRLCLACGPKPTELKFLVTFLKVLLIVKERERLCIERPTSR